MRIFVDKYEKFRWRHLSTRRIGWSVANRHLLLILCVINVEIEEL